MIELVLISGDIHGNQTRMNTIIEYAARLRDLSDQPVLVRIVVLGDFGYWVHQADGRAYIADTTAALETAGLPPLVFVDGNHEYHSTHRAKPEHKRFGLHELRPAADGFVHLSPKILWAPRGHRWTWAGVRFGALGGAVTEDTSRRKKWRDWWPEESIRPGNVRQLGAEPLDVLLTHDAPAGHNVPLHPDDDDGRTSSAASLANRDHLAAAVANTRPQLVLHGHWHVRYTHPARHADGTEYRVEGFAADEDPFHEQCAIVELPTLTLTPAT